MKCFAVLTPDPKSSLLLIKQLQIKSTLQFIVYSPSPTRKVVSYLQPHNVERKQNKRNLISLVTRARNPRIKNLPSRTISILNEIGNMSRRSRWFENPYPDYEAGKTEVKVNKDAIKKQALELLETAFAKGSRSGEGGIYVGAGGICYAYLHVAHLLTPEEKQKYLPSAFNAFQSQAKYYQINPSDRDDLPGFLLGQGGFYAIGAVWGKETGDDQFRDECIQDYIDCAKICKPLNFLKHGRDELFVGRAGYLCGALWMQQKLQYMPVPRQDLFDIWNAIIESGQTYAKQHKSPCPLMFSYYDTEYLGAAHGICAILQMLLAFPTFLMENPGAEKLIKDSIDYYLTLQDSEGNFPCSLDEVGVAMRRSHEDMLIHWCHGAPGAIYMLAKAYLHYKDEKYMNACIKCGEVVWNKGLLRKGPGICHGISGNGFVFLVIYNLLEGKDPKYLYRALKFAEFLSDSKFMRESRRPDCPYSLYEGIAGTACYLFDLLQPESAEFPFFNINNNYI